MMVHAVFDEREVLLLHYVVGLLFSEDLIDGLHQTRIVLFLDSEETKHPLRAVEASPQVVGLPAVGVQERSEVVEFEAGKFLLAFLTDDEGVSWAEADDVHVREVAEAGKRRVGIGGTVPIRKTEVTRKHGARRLRILPLRS